MQEKRNNAVLKQECHFPRALWGIFRVRNARGVNQARGYEKDARQQSLGMTRKNNCHSKLDLESHLILLRNDEILNSIIYETPYKNTTGRRPKVKAAFQDDERRKGFTLIELLVVVLIIGILAAIALPQYQLSVGKARAIRLLPVLTAVNNAQQFYYLEHGTYATEFDELSIDLNGKVNSTTKNLVFPDGSYCVPMKTGLLSLRCYAAGKPFIRLETYYSTNAWLQRYLGYKKLECFALQTDKLAQKICESLTGKKVSPSPTGIMYSYVLDSWR